MPFLPVGAAVLAYTPPSQTAFGVTSDPLSPVRDAASDGLFVGALAAAVAYALTRHPRWVLVGVLAAVAGADIRNGSSSVPFFLGSAPDAWAPALIVAAGAAAAAVAGLRVPGEGERRNLLVAAAVLIPVAAQMGPFGSGGDPGRDLFLAALAAAAFAIAWRSPTPGVAVGAVLTAALLAYSISEETGALATLVLAAGVVILAVTLPLRPTPAAAGGGVPPPGGTDG